MANFTLEVWDAERGDGYITVRWAGQSPFGGNRFEHFLRMTDAQLGDILSNNGYIQDVLGEASPDERELFITGMRPGSLGERTFTFNCFDCGEQKEAPITDLGQPYVCACGTVSHPFREVV